MSTEATRGIVETLAPATGWASLGALILKTVDLVLQKVKGKGDEISQFRRDLMQRNTDLVNQLRQEREAFSLEREAFAKERDFFKQETLELRNEIDALRKENVDLQLAQLNLYRKVADLEIRLEAKEKNDEDQSKH